jgi:hypothetical protein
MPAVKGTKVSPWGALRADLIWYTTLMIEEKWQQLVEQAKNDFDDVSYYTEDMLVEVRDGLLKDGTQDNLEFTNAKGRFKVVRQNRLQFGPKIEFYKENFGEWEKLDAQETIF